MGVIALSFSRKPPKPRFPFIVESYRFGQAAPPAAWSQGSEALVDIKQLLERVKEQCDDNGGRSAMLLKKIVYLESALDELLEENRIEQSDTNDSDAGLRSFISELLPVLDNVERLAELVVKSGQKDWIRGVKILHDKAIEVLNSRSVRVSAVRGMKFNPEHHESVNVDFDSQLPAGSISEIVESGWLFKDLVLRYAKVIVSKEKE